MVIGLMLILSPAKEVRFIPPWWYSISRYIHTLADLSHIHEASQGQTYSHPSHPITGEDIHHTVISCLGNKKNSLGCFLLFGLWYLITALTFALFIVSLVFINDIFLGKYDESLKLLLLCCISKMWSVSTSGFASIVSLFSFL